jgi:hypothetical protein
MSISSSVVVESIKSCSCEKWEDSSWDRGQFENPEKGERQSLEAATKQQLVKIEKMLCVLYLEWSLE